MSIVRRTILVVDDGADDRAMIRRLPANRTREYTVLEASTVEEGLDGEPTPGQRGQIERIQVGCRHLLDLINDVLDLARAERRGARPHDARARRLRRARHHAGGPRPGRGPGGGAHGQAPDRGRAALPGPHRRARAAEGGAPPGGRGRAGPQGGGAGAGERCGSSADAIAPGRRADPPGRS